ncbi:nickel pincer cofactor biosynthesis protein LarB [Thermobrachium celere]|uniref:nickel pincer cofactor biosynthesis protein LarB n=1 Tax=Thermobrachium celere TaxID=53422 RepID=UPI001943DE77|nr:nickel pincer cofactor biosynthesis protein LarB [Thermobrachium celere]GFR35321.1 1-(5-phosphoribosyl)-5-amino-4-imidazole-carboxyl ate carboxylase [Thermobrachium celere]
MQKNDIISLLEGYKNGELTQEEVLNKLVYLPYKDLQFAKLDYHREIRVGYPEVIYCEGKELEHLKKIVEDMLKLDKNILATRVSKEAYRAICEVTDNLIYSEVARICVINPKDIKKEGLVAVVTGGTADIKVAEEAAITLETFGNNVDRIYDVGVAGIHRLFNNLERIRKANVVVAVAGMEGALASVVAGLVDVPVIAVPTSVGYGANFNGLSALLTMLNSCAAGVSVVNIDNGFGAGYIASLINKRVAEGVE